MTKSPQQIIRYAICVTLGLAILYALKVNPFIINLIVAAVVYYNTKKANMTKK